PGKAEISRRWEVTSNDVVNVISKVAQIPEDMVFREVSDRFRDMEARLGERVVGQRQAIDSVAKRLVLNKGPLKDGFDRPDGVLLFLGPTGVGKTELAKSVAEFLFGDEKKMIRVDMSEYQDGSVAVDKLIGMPRGIVGSERGGLLTNQLKASPYRPDDERNADGGQSARQRELETGVRCAVPEAAHLVAKKTADPRTLDVWSLDESGSAGQVNRELSLQGAGRVLGAGGESVV